MMSYKDTYKYWYMLVCVNYKGPWYMYAWLQLLLISTKHSIKDLAQTKLHFFERKT